MQFRAPLEDPRYRLLVWRDKKLVPLSLAVGERVVIPWSPGPTGFF